jgi:LPS sulfotransferase NodH
MLLEILARLEKEPSIAQHSSLRFIRSVSSALPIDVLKSCERAFGIPVIEIYGMTETAGLITSTALPPANTKRHSVGLAAGPEVAIVNDSGDLMATGELGEVVTRGANVMAGYENFPDRTDYMVGDSWFRTGDQGYLDEEGYLFLTGRIKEIINRGGEKISPREVDDALLANPFVESVATFAVPHESLGEDVAAAVVLKAEGTLTKQELIAYAAERLAYFKVPRTIYFLEELPTGPGGKLQRLALPEMLGLTSQDSFRGRSAWVAPQNLIAMALADLYAEVLGAESPGVHDNFFDLGGDSLKAASFINTVQEKWGETLYVSALFDAPSISEFEAFLRAQYPELVMRMLGQRVSSSRSPVVGRVNDLKLAQLRKSIAPAARLRDLPNEKNPSAIFILSPPRSGSTLLRAMLGGSPRLFSPPELYLLSFDNLAQRKEWFSGSQQSLLEGNVRGLMQLLDKDADQAQALMEELEHRAVPTHEYYRMLQEWLGDRVLVDKTPWYAVHPVALERAEAYFEDALYIHLLRHPYGMIRSFSEAKLGQLWYPRLVDKKRAGPLDCPYHSTELAEMIWLILQENILKFLETVPDDRQHRIAFEALVEEPESMMQGLCEFLGEDFVPAMLDPRGTPRDRMTDGLHPGSRMIGDMKFHEHDRISSGTADLWKKSYTFDFLSDDTWDLARSLGYDETIAEANDREEFEI